MVNTFRGAGGGSSFSTDSATRYIGVGDSDASLIHTAEVNVQQTCRVAGTSSLLGAYIESNARSTSTTVTFRKNTADTALTFSISAGATGLVRDTSNSVSLADGDTEAIKVVTSTGGGAIVIRSFALQHVPSSGSPKQWSAISSNATGSTFGTASSSTNQTLAGLLVTNTTEANTGIVLPVDATLSNLQVYVVSNARGTATTYVLRDDAASVTNTFSIGAGATGLFEDTTHSDSIAAGSLINGRLTTGTGVGNIAISRVGVKLVTDGAGFPIAAAGAQAFSATSIYGRVLGMGADSATETEHYFKPPFACTLTNLGTNVTANAATVPGSVSIRINNATGNNTVSYAGGATGVQRDTTHSDTVAANDNLNVMASGLDGTMTARSVSAFVTEIVSQPAGNNIMYWNFNDDIFSYARA